MVKSLYDVKSSGTNISHQSTDWRDLLNSDFSTILVQSLNDTNMTTYTLSGISDGTTVYALGLKDARIVYSNYATSTNLSAFNLLQMEMAIPHRELGNGANSARTRWWYWW